MINARKEGIQLIFRDKIAVKHFSVSHILAGAAVGLWLKMVTVLLALFCHLRLNKFS